MSPPKNFIRKCQQCKIDFYGTEKQKFCNRDCAKLMEKEKYIQRVIAKGLLKFPDGSDPKSYISCKICGFRTTDLAQHPQVHGVSQDEYREKYGSLKCDRIRESMRGKNNMAYNHGGKLSPFSKKFIKYENVENVDEKVEEIKKRAAKTKIENFGQNTHLDYYTHRGMSLEEAQKALYERQNTFTKEKCIERYGEEEGLKVWQDRQERWQNTLKSKTPEEIQEINKKKSSKINYKSLWNLELEEEGNIYFLKITENSYKIGITSKPSIEKRYSNGKLLNTEVLLFKNAQSINHAFLIEQIIKKKYFSSIKKDNYGFFGWTEVLNNVDQIKIINEINELLVNQNFAYQMFLKIVKNEII